jgi:hypothetical protein
MRHYLQLLENKLKQQLAYYYVGVFRNEKYYSCTYIRTSSTDRPGTFQTRRYIYTQGTLIVWGGVETHFDVVQVQRSQRASIARSFIQLQSHAVQSEPPSK